MPINKKYSGKNFMGQTFLDVDPSEFSNSTIRRTCFAQEVLYGVPFSRVKIFPVGVVNLTFDGGNLDNVDITGFTGGGEGFSNRAIQIQNDLEDWVTDEDGVPLEPMDIKDFINLGIPTDPKYLPKTKQEIRIRKEVEEQLVVIDGS